MPSTGRAIAPAAATTADAAIRHRFSSYTDVLPASRSPYWRS
jgi:hypothetical protein